MGRARTNPEEAAVEIGEKKLRMEQETQRPKLGRRFTSLELERKQVCDQRRMLRKVKEDRVRAPRQEALQVAADLWRVLR